MENSNPNTNAVKSAASNKMPVMIGVAVVIVAVGLAVGFLVSSKKTTSKTAQIPATSKISVTSTEAGVNDPTTIKDVTTATGPLATGGIKGEGQYHIDRPGGKTQTVYLNSTTVDMSTFVGKKVQVWGQTIAAQHAPWLMDVMKIKIVE